MSPLVTYLVKVTLMYLLCFLLYWGLFRKETFFIRNRVFLLISLILPALIPLIHFDSGSAVANLMPEGGIDRILIVSNSSPATLPTPAVSAAAEMVTSPAPFPWETIALWMYLSGTLFFLLRMLWGYSGIIRLIIQSERKRLEKMILVITQRKVSPFSLFRWLVIPGNKLQHNDLDKIIRHETIHFRQWHSVDLLLSELLVAFQWFNPFAWMLKSSIVRNNEFFVDRKCLSWFSDVRAYQYALLASSFGERRISMANSFNQDLIKKRIEMMNRRNTRLINRIKDLLIVPFALLLIVAFSAYSGKPAETVVNSNEASLLTSQHGAAPQDKAALTDTAKRLNISFNGIKLIITDPASAKSSQEDIHILRLKDADSKWTVLAKEAFDKLMKTKEIDEEATLILIKTGKEDVGKNEIVGIMTAVDTTGPGTGRVALENHDGKIYLSASQGKANTLYIAGKGKEGIKIGFSTEGKGKELLYIVDGKEYKAGEWTLTDPDQIQGVCIIDSDAAVKEYGEKGKNGVIVITTKKR